MTDPVSRAARRQNLIDRIAEQLVEWGCPPDTTSSRAAGLLHLAEQAGWLLPVPPAPPVSGRGATREGIDRARRIFEQTRRGCRCGPDVVGRAYPWHLVDCPVRDAEGVADPASVGAAVIDRPPGYGDTPADGTEALRGSACSR